MKKKIHKIWGIGLVVVLVSSLLFSAAPVSGGTLSWGAEDLPDELVGTIGDDIVDIAVAGDGSTIYATINSTTIYRSTDSGVSWTSITVIASSAYLAADMIAVAPEDANYIAVTGNATTVFISDDAGANWDSLGSVNATTGIESFTDIALSVESSGNHFVAVSGVDGGAAEVSYYEIGAVGAAWTEASLLAGFNTDSDMASAVAFSPNFASDYVMAAVTVETTSSENVSFQIFDHNKDKWNVAGGFDGYPVDLTQDTAPDIISLDSASISMSPDYLGSDDSMRIVFIGLALTGATAAAVDETEGIQRLDNDDTTVLKDDIKIHSISFDGTNLVAGHYDSTNIRRSADPLASSPTVSGATTRKRPGGDTKAVVAWAGDDVVAGTSGDESAFAVSRDNGKTFNDLSLIDTELSTLSDVAVSPDGSKVYLATADNSSDLSVWRLASSWERVFTMQAADTDYIIRLAPDDPDVVYLADAGGGTAIYYSTDAGQNKWHIRVSRYALYDLAVESTDVAYVLTSSGYVSKSTNGGFTWATQKSSKLTAGGTMLVSMGEDKLLAGGLYSAKGRVSYSTDGGSTWTRLGDDIGAATTVQTVATGLADGDFVFAASSTADGLIYQWELGEDDEWSEITDAGDIGAATGVYGMALLEGVLYVAAANTTNSRLLRTLNPTADGPTWSTVDSAGEIFTATPSALRLSTGSLTKLWAIDRTTYPDADLFSYKDTLATTVATLTSPRDGASIPMNPVSGAASHVTLVWENPSDKVTEYDLVIALDSGFDEAVMSASPSTTGTWDEGDIISAVTGPGAAYDVSFMPGTTYYWRVRVDASGPVRSNWSEVRTFTVGALPEILPPVVLEPAPPPQITVEIPPAPSVTLPAPVITLPAPPPPPPQIVIPPAPAPAPAIPAWALYVIIIIGAVLVIALIVLIMRTRRPV